MKSFLFCLQGFSYGQGKIVFQAKKDGVGVSFYGRLNFVSKREGKSQNFEISKYRFMYKKGGESIG